MRKGQEQELSKYLNSLEKDAIIDLYLQKCFDFDMEVGEKDKEITKLKNELLQPQSEIINSKEDVIDAIQSLNLLQKQKAIEELKKNIGILQE